MRSVITQPQLDRALALRDLSDPAGGPHAMQLVAGAISDALERAWGAPVLVHRAGPVVTIHDELRGARLPARRPGPRGPLHALPRRTPAAADAHDGGRAGALRRALRPGGGRPTSSWRAPALSTAATWSIGSTSASRTSSTCGACAAASRSPPGSGRDDRPRRRGDPARRAAPGASRVAPVHDRGPRGGGRGGRRLGRAPRVRPGRSARRSRRAGSIPRNGRGWPWASASTARSCCGRASPTSASCARSDPRVAGQMLDLEPYRAVSAMPPTRRDLSIAVAEDLTAEELGDRIRERVEPGVLDAVEELAVVAETPAGGAAAAGDRAHRPAPGPEERARPARASSPHAHPHGRGGEPHARRRLRGDPRGRRLRVGDRKASPWSARNSGNERGVRPSSELQSRGHIAVRAGIGRGDVSEVECAPGGEPCCQEPLLVHGGSDGLVLHAAADQVRDCRGDLVEAQRPAARSGDTSSPACAAGSVSTAAAAAPTSRVSTRG